MHAFEVWCIPQPVPVWGLWSVAMATPAALSSSPRSRAVLSGAGPHKLSLFDLITEHASPICYFMVWKHRVRRIWGPLHEAIDSTPRQQRPAAPGQFCGHLWVRLSSGAGRGEVHCVKHSGTGYHHHLGPHKNPWARQARRGLVEIGRAHV